MSTQFAKKVAKESILAFVKGFFSRLGDIVAMVLFPFTSILGLVGKILGLITIVIGGSSTLSFDDPDSNIEDI